ncbi:glucokinase, partial [Methylorubrum suomiense]
VAAAWDAPPEVLEAAKVGDPLAREAVRQFARLLGRFAGDLALLFSATGGVYLAGGIAPRIVEALKGEAFRDAFEDKPPFREVMQAIPRFVITRPEPAIDGLAALLRAADRFLFPGQDWRA